MFIEVDDAGELRLMGDDNFKELSLKLPPEAEYSRSIKAALAAAGFQVKSDHAWIPADWLLAQRTTNEWRSDVRAMLEAVERFGWYERKTNRVQVHIVRVSDSD